MSTVLVEVRGLPGRVSLASSAGPALSTTEWTTVVLTPWLQRAIDFWGDVEQRPVVDTSLPQTAKEKSPAPAEKS
jgi:hypothetical protein